jgi:Tfp pilus assembly protein PilE
MRYIIVLSILFGLFISGCNNNSGYYRPGENQEVKSNINTTGGKPVVSSADQKKMKEMEMKAKISEAKTQKEIQEMKLQQKKLEVEGKKEIAKIEMEKEIELQKIKSGNETLKTNVQKEIGLKENVLKIKQLDNNLYLTITIIVVSVLGFIALIYIVYKIYKKSQESKVQMHKERMEHEKEIKNKELQMEVVGKIVDKLSDKNLTRGDKDKLLSAISTVSGNTTDPNATIEYKPENKNKKSDKNDDDIIDVK